MTDFIRLKAVCKLSLSAAICAVRFCCKSSKVGIIGVGLDGGLVDRVWKYSCWIVPCLNRVWRCCNSWL